MSVAAHPLDEHNTAPAGHDFDVPLTVEHQTGSGRAGKVTAEVSYDDGTTWRPAKVRGTGDTGPPRCGIRPGRASCRCGYT